MSTLLDTIIIGAGWAGAVTARELASKGHSVLVLEARERIGGRARTLTDTHGMQAPVDVGCSWIHGFEEGNPAGEIAIAVGVKAHVPKPTESQVYGPDGPLQPSVVSLIRSNLSSTRGAAQSFAQNATPAPNHMTPLSEFILSPASPLFTSLEHSLTEGFSRTMEISLGAPLETVSLRWAGWENRFSGSDAAPEGGFQFLVERVLDDARVLGVEVHLSELVQSFKRSNDGVVVGTDKATYNARSIVCTIPLGVLKHDPPSFDPTLPIRRREIITNTHVGALEKLVLVYPDAWWPGASSVGSFTFLPTQAQAGDSTDIKAILASHTLVMTSFAAPSLPNPHPTLLIFLSSTPARLLARFAPQDVTRAAHAFLVERFELIDDSSPPEPTTGVMTNWINDPFSRGATTTPSVIGDGRSPLDFVELGKPLWDGRLGFAGEHTDADHRGSVAGAIVSGQREAARVGRLLAYLAKKQGGFSI